MARLRVNGTEHLKGIENSVQMEKGRIGSDAAFDARHPELRVELMLAGNVVKCRVSDNGSADEPIRHGRGLAIIGALSRDEPGQRALCRLLSSLVGGYTEAFDEEPLPVAVADRAYQRLLDLVTSLDFRASAEDRLTDLNRVAACHLWH